MRSLFPLRGRLDVERDGGVLGLGGMMVPLVRMGREERAGLSKGRRTTLVGRTRVGTTAPPGTVSDPFGLLLSMGPPADRRRLALLERSNLAVRGRRGRIRRRRRAQYQERRLSIRVGLISV